MHIKYHRRGHGTSRNLNVMVDLQIMSVGMIKIVKGTFMSLGLVCFFTPLIYWCMIRLVIQSIIYDVNFNIIL